MVGVNLPYKYRAKKLAPYGMHHGCVYDGSSKRKQTIAPVVDGSWKFSESVARSDFDEMQSSIKNIKRISVYCISCYTHVLEYYNFDYLFTINCMQQLRIHDSPFFRY